ncbi:FtsX-like permease family protein [Psychromarinibacter sp. C21-152]|uniref:FtsX-like permease family protein n=1 Tax=Psychromarinibacter sediminicola TaxID=3033385 RepID=A0AAE3TAC8_9RHOB|nr:ABC transporter permease [Psychromarinibacter sediminicola]MDF0603560.1 FtsX-like permease family protein [Psychromarinibacter sediminicola]
MSPLDRKLLRDLGRIKGQVIAIMLVIGVGVMLQVMMSGLVASLSETQRAYYERNRMADVFAPVTRAPQSQLARLSQIPDVARVEGRVTGGALFDLPGEPIPIRGKAVSLPDQGEAAFNAVYLVEGALPAPGARDEILLLAGFAEANGYGLGDRIDVTMNGTRRTLRIVGLAEAPDLLFVAAPGEMVPDPARFGVIWMRRNALSAIYDMDGAFNEALFSLSRLAVEAEVLDRIDAVLDPWGGTGAYGRDDLVSDRFVQEEIGGLATMSRAVPPLFLAIAAFLLYIVVSRIVQGEREEIGLLKAFGYTGAEVGAHYFKMVLIVAVGGAALGCALGILSGRAMIPVYTQFYNFPFLVFRPDPASFVIGVSASIAAASAGGVFVLRRVFALEPAEAMRPPAPADYSRTITFTGRFGRMLDQPTRMVLRSIARQPLRAAALAAGIMGGMALASAMTTIYGAFDRMMALSFSVIDRSDATVYFTRPLGEKAALELARIPGVIAVEPMRNVSAVLRNGLKTHRGAVSGMIANPEMTRAIDADHAPIPLPAEGIVLGQALADILEIGPGETLTVEVREGRQPVLEVPVARVASSLLGAPAYMRLDALNRAMREPGRISGAHLQVDGNRADEIYRTLKDMPSVAGVSVAETARESLQKLMDQGAGSARYIMGAVAFIITFGIVYNAARIAQAERGRDLASLRVMGFSKGEAGFVLLGELAVITLVAIPLGSALGYALSFAIAAGFSSELYQIPATFDPFSHGFAASFVLGAAVVSGLLVKRDIDRTELITVLKSRE